MTTALEPHTVLPPPAATGDGHALAELRRAIGRGFAPGQHATLTSPTGAVVALPDEVYQVLREVVDALAQGLAISVAPLHAVLTTQQAADMLNISRPTLVKLLEDGEIPFEQPGRHRRVRLTDLLAYKERARTRRRDLLDAMTAEASDDEAAGDSVDGIIQTR
jgi:excisionase family DNA binding protein